MIRGITGYALLGDLDEQKQVQSVFMEAKRLRHVKIGSKAVMIMAKNEETPEETNIMKIMNID